MRGPDCVFPSGNAWGVPTLDLRLQADLLPVPFLAWGSVARSKRMRGCYHFYCHDYKFAALWANPLRLIETGCAAAVEPNYSTNEQLPLARVLWDVYRKRWLARLWQAHGLRVLVDLNVAVAATGVNLLGVPRGWRAFATRYNAAGGLADIDQQAAAAVEHSGGPINLVVYSGGPAVAAHCAARGWVHVANQAGEKGERLKAEG